MVTNTFFVLCILIATMKLNVKCARSWTARSACKKGASERAPASLVNSFEKYYTIESGKVHCARSELRFFFKYTKVV